MTDFLHGSPHTPATRLKPTFVDRKTGVRVWDGGRLFGGFDDSSDSGMFSTNWQIDDPKVPGRTIHGRGHFQVWGEGQIDNIDIGATWVREPNGQWRQLNHDEAANILGVRGVKRLGSAYKSFVSKTTGVPRNLIQSSAGDRISGARSRAYQQYWQAVDSGQRPRDPAYEATLQHAQETPGEIDMRSLSGPIMPVPEPLQPAVFARLRSELEDYWTLASQRTSGRTSSQIRSQIETLNAEVGLPRNFGLLGSRRAADQRWLANRISGVNADPIPGGPQRAVSAAQQAAQPTSPRGVEEEIEAEVNRDFFGRDPEADPEVAPGAYDVDAFGDEGSFGGLTAREHGVVMALSRRIADAARSMGYAPHIADRIGDDFAYSTAALRALENENWDIDQWLSRPGLRDQLSELVRTQGERLTQRFNAPLQEAGPGLEPPVAREVEGLETRDEWGGFGPDDIEGDYTPEPGTGSGFEEDTGPYGLGDVDPAAARVAAEEAAPHPGLAWDELPPGALSNDYDWVLNQWGRYEPNRPFEYINRRTGAGMRVKGKGQGSRAFDPNSIGQWQFVKFQFETLGDANPDERMLGHLSFDLDPQGRAVGLSIITDEMGVPGSPGFKRLSGSYQDAAEDAAGKLGRQRMENLIRGIARYFVREGMPKPEAEELLRSMFQQVEGIRVTGIKPRQMERLRAKRARGEPLTPQEEKFMLKGARANLNMSRTIERMLREDPLSGPALAALRASELGRGAVRSARESPEMYSGLAGAGYGLATPAPGETEDMDFWERLQERTPRALGFAMGGSALGALGRVGGAFKPEHFGAPPARSGPVLPKQRTQLEQLHYQSMQDWLREASARGRRSPEALAARQRAEALEAQLSTIDDANATGSAIKERMNAVRSALPKSTLSTGPALAPAITAALPQGTGTNPSQMTRLLGAAGEAALGALLSQNEDENLRSTGWGLLGFAAFTALGPGGRAAIGARSKLVAQRYARQHELVRKALDIVSPSIMLDNGVTQAIDESEVLHNAFRVRSEKLAQEIEELGPEADRFLTDVITGERFSQYMPTPEEAVKLTKLAASVVELFEEQRVQKEALGLLAPGGGVRTGYLPRYQLRHMLEEGERLQPVTRTADPNAPRQRAERGRTLDASQIAERDYLGEIREASFAVRHGGARGGAQIANAKLLQALHAQPGSLHPQFSSRQQAVALAHQAYLQARAAGAPNTGQIKSIYDQAVRDLQSWGRSFRYNQNWKRLPESPALGPMSGAVVQREVADYVLGQPVHRTAYDGLLRAWKTSKTAYNLPTHVGNFMSNIYLAHMAGVPIWRLPGALVDGADDIAAYGDATRYLMEQGILNKNVLTEGSATQHAMGASAAERLEKELRVLMRTTRPATEKVLKEYGFQPQPVPSKLMKRAEELHSAVTGLYSNEDNWFRVAVYKQKLSEGWTQEQAGNYARWSMVNYDTKSPLLAFARRTAFPFIIFPAKALPMVLTQAADHPIRFLTAAALFATGAEVLQSTFPEVNATDVPADIRKPPFGYLLPQMLPVGIGNEGQRYFADVTRLTPFSALTTNAPPGTVLGQTLPNLPLAAAQPSGPIMDIAALAQNRDPYSGRPILRPGSTGGEQALAGAGFLAQRAAPPMVGFHGKRLYGDLRDERYGDMAVDALGLVGARPRIIPRGEAARRAQARYNEAVRDIETSFRYDAQRARNSPEALLRARERLQTRMKNALENYRHALRP